MKSTIYLNNQWYTIPQEDGMIPGTSLYASWQRSESDGFKFAKIAFFKPSVARIARKYSFVLSIFEQFLQLTQEGFARRIGIHLQVGFSLFE